MSEYQERRTPGAARSIDELRDVAYQALITYRREQALTGRVSSDTRHQMARAALAWRERLLNFRDDPALHTPWNDRNVDWIAELAARSVVVEQSLPRSNGNVRHIRRSALSQAPPERVAETIQELMRIASELGFEAETRKTRSRGVVGGGE